MEIHVQPSGFTVLPTKIPTPAGEIDGVRVMVVDQTGITVNVTFGQADWEAFQRFIADPQGEAAKAQARAKILPVGGMAPTVRGRKH